MSNNVFVVTQGEYSSYHIVAVFSSKEKAEAFALASTDKDSCVDIEKYELDATDEDGFLQPVFWACVEVKTGSLLHSYQLDAKIKPLRWAQMDAEAIPRGGQGILTVAAHSCISQDHANKLALEARQVYLRAPLTPAPPEV